MSPNLERQHGRAVCALDSGSKFTPAPGLASCVARDRPLSLLLRAESHRAESFRSAQSTQ